MWSQPDPVATWLIVVAAWMAMTARWAYKAGRRRGRKDRQD